MQGFRHSDPFDRADPLVPDEEAAASFKGCLIFQGRLASRHHPGVDGISEAACREVVVVAASQSSGGVATGINRTCATDQAIRTIGEGFGRVWARSSICTDVCTGPTCRALGTRQGRTTMEWRHGLRSLQKLPGLN